MTKIIKTGIVVDEIRQNFLGEIGGSVYSILQRGSSQHKDELISSSDFDISIILNMHSWDDLININSSLDNISKRVGLDISPTFIEKRRLFSDIESRVHIHGDKDSTYAKELSTCPIIFGQDLSGIYSQFENYDVGELYFSFFLIKYLFEKLRKNDNIDEHKVAYKGTKFAHILVKKALLSEGIFENDKAKAISRFSEMSAKKVSDFVNAWYEGSCLGDSPYVVESLIGLFDAAIDDRGNALNFDEKDRVAFDNNARCLVFNEGEYCKSSAQSIKYCASYLVSKVRKNAGKILKNGMNKTKMELESLAKLVGVQDKIEGKYNPILYDSQNDIYMEINLLETQIYNKTKMESKYLRKSPIRAMSK